MNAGVRLYADAMSARTKKENGFDLTEYDQRCLNFSYAYAERILAIDVNLKVDEMLDTTWELFSEHFERHEVGIKDQMMNKYWKGKS
jgi:V/A-type H+-transporting ATPase subunit B